MKKLFFSLVTLIAATLSFAQNTLVATLSHGEDISMFYGTYALRDALDAAANGDVINLSGGVFQAVNITKAVTMRGTGIDDDVPTYIFGDFIINIAPDDTNQLSMEGVRCTGNITMEGSFSSPLFIKSQFATFSYPSNSTINNSMFVNCKIVGNSFLLEGTNNAKFINCYVEGFGAETSASAIFYNCVIRPYIYGRSVHLGYVQSSSLVNCILYEPGYLYYGETYQYLRNPTTAINCISIGYPETFNNLQINSNCRIASYAEVFKNFTGTYSDDQTFELTDEAKTAFLGTDGTEIGLYGGIMPYTSTPSYPQITKMNVANKTTADGKLSVEIEVSAAQ